MKIKTNMRVIAPLLGLGAGLISLSTSAAAQVSLPMKYYPDATVQNPPDDAARLYVGASAQSIGGDIVVTPTGTLYVAPNTSTVSASGFQRYATANCPVVENERANERTASDLMRFQLDQIKSFKSDIEFYNDESRNARKECLLAKKNHASDAQEKCDYAKEVSASVKDLGDQLLPWTTQVAAISDASTKRLEVLGRQLGGFAAATVSLYNPATLQTVMQSNPSFNAAWVGVKDVTFSFTTAEEGLADTPENSLSMRTTLGFSLAGQPLPDGQLDGTVGAKNAITSGGNVALGITLSRLGACDDKLLRAGVFFYKFDSFSYVKGKAKINKWAAYEKIERNKTSGGFFTTKAVHELYEDIKGGQTHEVIVEGVPDTDLSEEKKKLEADILADLLSEMADAQALKANPGAVMGLPTPGQNGATVLADGLQKCPHIYCQAGAFVLKGLSAIFGSTESRDEIKRQFNVKVERQYAYNKRHDETGAAATLVRWNL